jgi:hypothetical protein
MGQLATVTMGGQPLTGVTAPGPGISSAAASR